MIEIGRDRQAIALIVSGVAAALMGYVWARRVRFAQGFDVIGAFDVLEHIDEERIVLGKSRHREQKTAIGGLWALTGYEQIGLPVNKGVRGETSYSVIRPLAVGLDSLTSFGETPLILVFLLAA